MRAWGGWPGPQSSDSYSNSACMDPSSAAPVGDTSHVRCDGPCPHLYSEGPLGLHSTLMNVRRIETRYCQRFIQRRFIPLASRGIQQAISTGWLQKARSNMPRCKRHKILILTNQYSARYASDQNRASRGVPTVSPAHCGQGAGHQSDPRRFEGSHGPQTGAEISHPKPSFAASLQLNPPNAPLRPSNTPESAITAFFPLRLHSLILAARNESRA